MNCYLAGISKTRKAVAISLRVASNPEWHGKPYRSDPSKQLFDESDLFREAIQGITVIKKRHDPYTDEEIEEVALALYKKGEKLWKHGFVAHTKLEPDPSPDEMVQKHQFLKTAGIDLDYRQTKYKGKGVTHLLVGGVNVPLKEIRSLALEYKGDKSNSDCEEKGENVKREHWTNASNRGTYPDHPTVSIVLQKPMSAYFFFMADVRAKTKADNPDAGMTELGKIMGAEWNKIKETAAADKYKEKATADKARYEKEMKKYKGE